MQDRLRMMAALIPVLIIQRRHVRVAALAGNVLRAVEVMILVTAAAIGFIVCR